MIACVRVCVCMGVSMLGVEVVCTKEEERAPFKKDFLEAKAEAMKGNMAKRVEWI